MTNKTVILPGGTGFLGQHLAYFLKNRGYNIVILSRGDDKVENGIEYIHWDGKILGRWTKYLDGSLAIINFTGRSVNTIYTEERKKEIIESRVDSVRVLIEAILQSQNPPTVFIQAASLAIYGNTTALCDENAPLGQGFSADVCKRWEHEFFKTDLPKTRKVLYRIGFALGKDGGALDPLRKLTKYYMGGTIGSGNQYISWIHIDDLNRMLLFALQREDLEGIYNATGVNPATNKEFMSTLREVLGMPWSPPVPSFLVKIGAYLIMQSDPSLALAGRRCVPKRLLEEGFNFNYTNLQAALAQLTVGERD